MFGHFFPALPLIGFQDTIIDLAGLSDQFKCHLDAWFAMCRVCRAVVWAHVCPFADKSWIAHFPWYAIGLWEELLAYELVVCEELTWLGGDHDTLELTDVLWGLDNTGAIFVHRRVPMDLSETFCVHLLLHLNSEWLGWFGPCIEAYSLPPLIDEAYDAVVPLAPPSPPCSPSLSSDGEASPLPKPRCSCSCSRRRGRFADDPVPSACGHGRGCLHRCLCGSG
jgi:hypothetical protein